MLQRKKRSRAKGSLKFDQFNSISISHRPKIKEATEGHLEKEAFKEALKASQEARV